MDDPALPRIDALPGCTIQGTPAATIAVAISSLGAECASARVVRRGPLLGAKRSPLAGLRPEAVLREKDPLRPASARAPGAQCPGPASAHGWLADLAKCLPAAPPGTGRYAHTFLEGAIEGSLRVVADLGRYLRDADTWAL